MSVILVLTLSVLMQFSAALYSLNLLRHFGGRLVWLALAAALFLMTIRRSLSLYKAVDAYPVVIQSLETELVAMLISALVLIAVLSFRPLIEKVIQSEQKLVEEKQRNNIILESSPDGVCIITPPGIIEEVNPAYCQMLGLAEEVLLGKNFNTLTAVISPHKSQDIIKKIILENDARSDLVQFNKHNQPVYLELIGRYVVSSEHDFIYLFLRDTTERHEVEAKLKEQKERALVTLASIGDGVITTNLLGEVDFMNDVAEEMCGIKLDDAKGRLLEEVCYLLDEKTKISIDDPVVKALLENGPLYLSHNIELQNLSNMRLYSLEVVVSPIFDNQNIAMGTVLVLHDTTELRGMAQQLSYHATHDSLTGLINRREFEKRLNDAIETVKHGMSEYVLFYMDLDQFKIINDTCGHIAGDDLLLKVTQLFGNCVRESDTLARLGGDEFGVLLEACQIEKAKQIASVIHDELNSFRFCWEDNIFEVGVSIGIVTINDSVISISELLSAADSACYVAKERGRNSQHTYIEGDQALAQHHGEVQWYQRIQHAFEKKQFEIYMQEIKPTNSNDLTHAEILLRMVGDGEVISPKQFLPTAERYHIAVDIDRWVLRRVFSVMASGDYRLAKLGGVCAINISGQSLGKEGFLDYVSNLFNEFRVDGKLICFEITETAVISNISLARKFMIEMKSKGCQFSLDDFGSGLSSFTYLKSLDVDYIKIDGSFVQNILADKDDFTMVSTINHLGHSLGLKTIAEFAESQEVIEVLENIGLDYIQGYAIDMPSPVLIS